MRLVPLLLLLCPVSVLAQQSVFVGNGAPSGYCSHSRYIDLLTSDSYDCDDQGQVWGVAVPSTKVSTSRMINGHALSADVTVTKADVSLGNVPNLDTSNPANITADSTHRFATDAEKSTWNGKQDSLGFTAVPNTRTVNGQALSGNVTLAKSDVGLGNVANVDTTNAANISSGTLPDARFPATLPAASGVNLTALNASNAASGTLPAGRMPALTGDVTTSAGGVATTIGATKVTNAMLAGSIDLTSKVTGVLPWANGGNAGSAATSATTGTMTVSMTTAVVTITPSGACTFNATGGLAGQQTTFVITTSGSSSFVLTWGTNYKTVGTLATGVTTAKTFAVTFVNTNGTTWVEVARTTAM